MALVVEHRVVVDAIRGVGLQKVIKRLEVGARELGIDLFFILGVSKVERVRELMPQVIVRRVARRCYHIKRRPALVAKKVEDLLLVNSERREVTFVKRPERHAREVKP